MPKDQYLQPWERGRRSGRLIDVRGLRPKFLIVTNGETETVYFNNYKTSTGPKVVTITKRIHQTALVDVAIDKRTDLIGQHKYDIDIDETWVVIDRDLNLNDRKDGQHFNEALRLAKNQNVNVAFSNDAFEVWFVLHFQDLNRHTSRQELCKILEKNLGRPYQKGGKEDMYTILKPHREKALERAAWLYKQQKAAEGGINPSTTVHLLVKKLMDHPGFRER